MYLTLNHSQKLRIRVIFIINLFSTLAFSVLYSTLLLYLTKQLNFSSNTAIAITGSFLAFNYFLHLVGGFIGGRFLSYRMLFITSMIFQSIGSLLLATTSIVFLYWGLALFLTGSGFSITCINCMLTQVFESHDKNRESAFLWNYSGMNIGFFIGFTLSGFLQIYHNYSLLFILASVSNLITLVIAFASWTHLKDIDTIISSHKYPQKLFAWLIGFGIISIIAYALNILIQNAIFSNELILLVGGLMLLIIAALALKTHPIKTAKKLWTFLILSLASLIFWTLYQIAPMGLTVFAVHNVNLKILNFSIPPQWLQNINTIIIVISGPLLASISRKLRRKGYIIHIPIQFSCALFAIGIGFLILPIGIHFANTSGLSNISWIIISYILQSIGEILLSPIGFSMIGELIPKKLQGLMMGIWLMVIGVAATLSNYFSQIGTNTNIVNKPLLSNLQFSHVFSMLGYGSVAAGVILISISPILNKWIREKKSHLQPRPYNSTDD